LFVFAALVAGVAAFASLFEPGPFYAALKKPSWTPPDTLFGVVWPVLYVLIALAGWICWRAQGLGLALWVWLLQLALNAAWPWLMFGRKQIHLALIEIGALWVAILAFILLAWPARRTAALLFAPYLAWVSYAAALNFAIWQLNR
jgi:tryptophan-rich sensory protein